MKIKIFEDKIENKNTLEDEINNLLIENDIVKITQAVYNKTVCGNLTHTFISICVLYEPKSINYYL